MTSYKCPKCKMEYDYLPDYGECIWCETIVGKNNSAFPHKTESHSDDMNKGNSRETKWKP